jgi:uncharacterized protein with von Willebrand factor type A (vWA) domain
VSDLARAIAATGWEDREVVREATLAIVCEKAALRPRLSQAFDAFFSSEPSLDLWARLSKKGFTEPELEVLRELLLAMATTEGTGFASLLDRGGALDRLLQLARVRRQLEGLTSSLQLGFFTQRVVDAVGVGRARERLLGLRLTLRSSLGERGDALADALAEELDRTRDVVKDHVHGSLERAKGDEKRGGGREETPFAALSDRDAEEVRHAVRSFADRLRGRERVRTRRARRGRIDPRRTLAALRRTGGVPFTPERRRKRRDKPRLVLLCDVSDSVRAASGFMLELVYAAQDVYDRTRSFVFVSELGETTSLFDHERRAVALRAAYSGDVVPVTANSNYGRVLRAFEDRYGRSLDRRTTVVILGDGRTNYHEAAEDSLARIRRRCRALYWLCTEPRGNWWSGDSAMRLYAPHCTLVLPVTNARELEEAARTMARPR